MVLPKIVRPNVENIIPVYPAETDWNKKLIE
jgi:hypothetical protein